MDLQAMLANPRARLAAAAGAGVVVLALFMRSRTAKKPAAGVTVGMAAPTGTPSSTADVQGALAALNNATQAIISAANQPTVPAANPGTAAGGAGNTATTVTNPAAGWLWDPTGRPVPTPAGGSPTYTYWLPTGQPVTVPMGTPQPLGSYDGPPSTWGR